MDLDESVCDEREKKKKKKNSCWASIVTEAPGSETQFVLSTAAVFFCRCRMWDMTAHIAVT